MFPGPVFANGGSTDKDVKPTGKEFISIMKLFPNKYLLFLVYLLTLCQAILPMFMNILFGDMTTSMSQTTDFLGSIKDVVIKMAIFIVCICLLNCIQYSLRCTCVPKFFTAIRMKIYSNLIIQPISYFDTQNVGVIMSRLSEDMTLINEAYFDKFLELVECFAQILTGYIISLVKAWAVTLGVMAVIPIILITTSVSEYFVAKLWKDHNDKTTRTSAQAQETITQFRTVKSFDSEIYENARYSDGLKGIGDTYMKASIIHGIKGGIVAFCAAAEICIVCFLSTFFILRKPNYGVEPGDLVLLIALLSMTSMGTARMLDISDDFRKGNIASAKILQLINLEAKIDLEKGNEMKEVKGKIEFKNVTFKYETREENAIDNLSFSIEPGQTVALVGESGCGKTTTLALLQRFYEIEEGEILLDNINISTLSPKYLRSQISIVSQTPVLFSMSIADNIRYSRPDATVAEVEDAAQIGNSESFIKELENGFETNVTQNSLSGGQKQRLCISRAILADTPILLLDEATAALDTESERMVQESLEKFRVGKTSIIVAHRLATVKSADVIYVMSKGSIVERGTHEELLSKDGIYADLVKFQLQ